MWLIAEEETGGKSLWIKAAAKMTIMHKSSLQWQVQVEVTIAFQLKSDSLLLWLFEVHMKWDCMMFI